jgi:hypothetical protein
VPELPGVFLVRIPMSEELEQSVLWDHEDDEALLFSSEQVRKQYTAGQAKKIEWRREAILMLLAAGWPVRRIKDKLHANTDTIVALAKQSGEKVGALNTEFSEILVRMAAGFFGIAATKAHDAPYKDLMLGAGIALTHARELKTMGLLPEKESTTIEEDRVEAAARLHAAMTEELARQVETPAKEVAGQVLAPAGQPLPAGATPQPVVSCGVARAPASSITGGRTDESEALTA